jgi:hypothetical protein
MKTAGFLIPMILVLATPAAAHVGSPDVFLEAPAGPYRLLVTVRPPEVIPGVAEVQVRSATPDVRELHIVPLPLAGEGARFAPVPDLARRSPEDPQLFSGALWMMSAGSWQVRVLVDGARGRGELAVPVPTLPQRTRGMRNGLALALFALLLLLGAGAVGIVGAGVREAALAPGALPDAAALRRARIAMGATATLLVLVLLLGRWWWSAEAAEYARYVYKPMRMTATVEKSRLELRLQDPGWLRRRVDDLLPDHDHLMHLFVLRLPALDRVWHLHPEQEVAGLFAHELPAMPAGRYALFADIVHRTGVPETMVAELELPEIEGRPGLPSGDDAAGSAPPLGAAGPVSLLSDGARVVWEREPGPLRARRPTAFRFRVETADGRPVDDLELYMGMLGHAAFVRADRSVFAHVHPTGSVPMAVLALAQPGDPHAAHHLMVAEAAARPSTITFPYGLPRPGDYRIFVQLKRHGRVETAAFDAHAEE